MASGTEDVGELLRGTAYRAIRVLGRGGMGLVVEAERTDLGRSVAVKVLHGELAKDRGIVDRLRIEAQTLGRITSPHVVQVLDLGSTADGRPYLAMEHLHGRTLRDQIKAHGRLAPDLALDVADQALRGLGEAHAIGIVHRDVKPENVFLADGRAGSGWVVKVLDFGVAKVLRGGSGIAPPIVPTDEGVTVGTPRYLAPEQVLGSTRVDPRADLYALGLVLWAMLVGKFPFDDCSDAVELARRQLQGAGLAPPSTLVDGLPRAVDALIARATAKDRDARYADADAFRRAIEVARSAVRAASEPAPVTRQQVTFAMETLDPATLLEATVEAPEDPSTVDASTRRDPAPELPTVALPSIDPSPVPTTRPAAPRTLASAQSAIARGPQTLQSSVANRPASPVTTAMTVGDVAGASFPSGSRGAGSGGAGGADDLQARRFAQTPTPPPVALAAERMGATDGPQSQAPWLVFAIVVVVTVLVLGAIGAAVLFFGLGGIADGAPPVSSARELG